MGDSNKGDLFVRDSGGDDGVLLLAVRLRIARETLGYTQGAFAEKLALTLDQYKKLEEGEHGPDTEKTLALLDGGLHFKRIHATTKIPRDVVRMLFPRNGDAEDSH